MMGDIRSKKNELRKEFREYRAGLGKEEKDALDYAIFRRVVSCREYKKAPLILSYMSMDIEVDTRRIIEYSMKLGKRVALPKCISGTRDMEFFIVSSLDDLESGAFGVLEPSPEKCPPCEVFDSSFCIVPGLGFDKNGFRIGFGKGYYDRFLSDYPGHIAGVCYSACVRNSLPHGRFDRRVNFLITERYQKRTSY
ncbi:MAG: 5-formyltetrahydrofolate cyclo-ligase [Clostridia bacterium]|nr:5-formyltetrahydrofolate cyclo-ligase [Clostridia bacterium]